MIRHERFEGGVCVEAEIWDCDNGSVIYERFGVEISRRQMTDSERQMCDNPKSDRESALAKLQALGLTEAEALALVGGL